MGVRSKWGRKLRRKIVLPKIELEADGLQLTGPFSDRKLNEVFACKDFGSVSFRNSKFIGITTAREIAKAARVRDFGFWCKISRPALSLLMSVPGLKEVLVSDFAGPGRLRDFRKALDVEIFRGFYVLRSADLAEIANLPKLQILIAHGGEFGFKSVERIAELGTLRQVDFEGVAFVDDMAIALAKSQFITDVILPATQLSKAGLNAICQMPQLRYLDIWANGFCADDLEMLAGHAAIEKIELGGGDCEAEFQLKASDIIPKLERMPALKTVSFENVFTTEAEIAILSERYEFQLLLG